MHVNVSAEQHTNSIQQLVKNISTHPESVKELGQWGLEISSQILMVSLGNILIAVLMHMRPSFSPFLECVSFLFYLFGVFLQTQGRTLPLETICLQSSSFTAGTDFSWSREVVRDAAISSVRDCLIKKSKPKSGQSEFIFADSVICISTHSPTWGVLIDCLLFILCLDSPQCLGHLLSSPLCRAD